MDDKSKKETGLTKAVKEIKETQEIQEEQETETVERGITVTNRGEEDYNLPATHRVPPPKLINAAINSLNTQEKLLSFATLLVKGKMCSFKEPSDAVVALITGQEFGLGLTAILGGIYVIEGKPSLGVHLKKGILLSKGVMFKKVRDMEPYYEYVEIIDGVPSVIKYGYLDEQPPNTKKKHIDTRTEYVFNRYFNTPKGVMLNTAVGMYSLSEAKQAGLLDKANWEKYTRDMLSSRAFSRGSNEIADDLLNGMLSFSELADINDGMTYYIDENGHEQIVK